MCSDNARSRVPTHPLRQGEYEKRGSSVVVTLCPATRAHEKGSEKHWTNELDHESCAQLKKPRHFL